MKVKKLFHDIDDWDDDEEEDLSGYESMEGDIEEYDDENEEEQNW